MDVTTCCRLSWRKQYESPSGWIRSVFIRLRIPAYCLSLPPGWRSHLSAIYDTETLDAEQSPQTKAGIISGTYRQARWKLQSTFVVHAREHGSSEESCKRLDLRYENWDEKLLTRRLVSLPNTMRQLHTQNQDRCVQPAHCNCHFSNLFRIIRQTPDNKRSIQPVFSDSSDGLTSLVWAVKYLDIWNTSAGSSVAD